MVKTIGSLLDCTLGLWNDRCDTLHGAIDAERKRIHHDRVSKQVVHAYNNKDKMSIDGMSLFKGDVGEMCKTGSKE